jgi:glycosyltransferase involved in cell wall biosynthesis
MIAIVYPQFYGVGGIARYLDSFLANLPANAPPVYLITGDEHRSERQYRGVTIIHVPFTSSRFSLFQWGLQVRRLLKDMHRQGQIRVVNFHFPPLIPGLFLPRSVPMVLTAHTTYLGMSGQFTPQRHFDSPWSASSVRIKQWMERRIFGAARSVIALTEQGHQEVLRYGYRRPVHVIPNGVDLKKFNPDHAVAKDIDVLFVGRIEIRKGSRPMVALCKQLVQMQPDVRIAIVGYGDDDEFVTAELSRLAPHVTLLGQVPFEQVAAYYSRAKVYASTSYYEGLPGTCLEAMAMELPVVVWDQLFYRGLVQPELSGQTVPVNDIPQMASRLLALCARPEKCQRMGQAGRARLAEDYDWITLAQQLVGILTSADKKAAEHDETRHQVTQGHVHGPAGTAPRPGRGGDAR